MNPNYNGTNGANEGSEEQNNGRAFTGVPLQQPYGMPMPPGFVPPGILPQGIPVLPQMYPGPFVAPPFMAGAVPVGINAPPVQQMNPDTTGYFGNLSPSVNEDVFTAILTCCGGFKRLKRPVDPSSGRPKPFAFVEFEGRDDLFRVFGLLQDFPLDNRHLNIKIEGTPSSTSTSAPSSNDLLEQQLRVYEGISRILIGKKVTGGGSMEWLERKLAKIREEKEEQGRGDKIRRDSRQGHGQRNYSDLLETAADENNNNNEPQFTKTPTTTHGYLAQQPQLALKERERRWEGRVKEFERELCRDLGKDEERTKRHAKEAAELADFIDKFADFDREGVFFTDREKWRKIRQRAAEKEAEIFSEVSLIRREHLIKTQREFIEKSIPSEREEIFAFPIRWDRFPKISAEFKEICRERTMSFFPSHRDLSAKLGDFIFEEICEKKRTIPTEIVTMEPTFLAVSNDSSEAEILLMIIWRWLIYLTYK